MTVFSSGLLEKAILSHYSFNVRNPLLLLDSTYVLISDEQAASYFRSVSEEAANQLGPWQENMADCDKYARFVVNLAMLTHIKSPAAKGQKHALGIGVFAYISKSEGAHAINFMVTKVTGKKTLKIRLFEPQTGEEVFLSGDEKDSLLWAIL
jgi:hypothetical protein